MKNIGLGASLLKTRSALNLSLQKCSKEMKINVATLSRIEKGHDFHPSTGAKIVLWIESQKKEEMKTEQTGSEVKVKKELKIVLGEIDEAFMNAKKELKIILGEIDEAFMMNAKKELEIILGEMVDEAFMNADPIKDPDEYTCEVITQVMNRLSGLEQFVGIDVNAHIERRRQKEKK